MRRPFTMPTEAELDAANAQFGPLDRSMLALGFILEWWDALPARLRQDIEGSGGEPGCIAAARRIVDKRGYEQQAEPRRRAMPYDFDHEAKACTSELFYRNGHEPAPPGSKDVQYIKETIERYLREAYAADRAGI